MFRSWQARVDLLLQLRVHIRLSAGGWLCAGESLKSSPLLWATQDVETRGLRFDDQLGVDFWNSHTLSHSACLLWETVDSGFDTADLPNLTSPDTFHCLSIFFF